VEFTSRRLKSGELDHELIWLSVSLGSLAIAAGWMSVGLPWPQCVFHHLTGLPCVTCGMTRCAIAFFQCRLLDAWNWNPLIFVSLCGLAIFDVCAFVVIVTDAPRLRISFSTSGRTYARGAGISALVLNWIYLLAHWQKFS
jgi:hypothetical protein